MSHMHDLRLVQPDSMRAKYDTSTKPFEVLCKEYIFDKYSRKLRNDPRWRHYKYYRTFEGARDALMAFRNSSLNDAYRDYPAMGNVENEAKYPHIRPTITIKRFLAVERIVK